MGQVLNFPKVQVMTSGCDVRRQCSIHCASCCGRVWRTHAVPQIRDCELGCRFGSSRSVMVQEEHGAKARDRSCASASPDAAALTASGLWVAHRARAQRLRGATLLVSGADRRFLNAVAHRAGERTACCRSLTWTKNKGVSPSADRDPPQPLPSLLFCFLPRAPFLLVLTAALRWSVSRWRCQLSGLTSASWAAM